MTQNRIANDINLSYFYFFVVNPEHLKMFGRTFEGKQWVNHVVKILVESENLVIPIR